MNETVWNGATTGWLLVAGALTMLMVPGVAFFYGGMVRAGNVLGTIAQSLAVLALGSVTWIVAGFSIAFSAGNPLFGDLSLTGWADAATRVPGIDLAGVPLPAFVFFQMMFAVVTPALITGATAERWRFSSFAAFTVLWSVLVYAPVAHWLFSPHGWAAELGALDYAGGAVVHANAGAAALACSWVLGRRRLETRPHNLPIMLLGGALLWFGWFGFNGGSALHPDSVAATAVLNTQLAAAMGVLGWAGLERVRVGKPTTLGIASGAVSGLVAITPAAGYVSPLSALLIGLIGGLACQLAVGLKTVLRLDDSLDVAAVHLVGGVVGAVSVGLFASHAVNPKAADGLFLGGGYTLLGAQSLATLAVIGWSLLATVVICRFTDRLFGNRLTARDESIGLDLSQHGETAYVFDRPVGRHTAADLPRGDSDHARTSMGGTTR
ncbi:ammonium transporter [Catellatospora chokoriensis]|uniref:Ammonium transporter n=1 Tax=Catellatospora chokoriensis TaxID=310353 RepID=A0A8J3KCH5_9ACTN|nr:ammonium transporter [Catellatospora chokoriensis]GIF94248.1 ammonium transporter [Catellatospora chokoriensis]